MAAQDVERSRYAFTLPARGVGEKERRVEAVVEVDLAEVARLMVRQAADSKGKKATKLKGKIVVRIVKESL